MARLYCYSVTDSGGKSAVGVPGRRSRRRLDRSPDVRVTELQSSVDEIIAAVSMYAVVAFVDTFRVRHPDDTTVGTVHGVQVRRDERRQIDYVLVQPGTEVLSADIVRTSRNGRYPYEAFSRRREGSVTAVTTLTKQSRLHDRIVTSPAEPIRQNTELLRDCGAVLRLQSLQAHSTSTVPDGIPRLRRKGNGRPVQPAAGQPGRGVCTASPQSSRRPRRRLARDRRGRDGTPEASEDVQELIRRLNTAAGTAANVAAQKVQKEAQTVLEGVQDELGRAARRERAADGRADRAAGARRVTARAAPERNRARRVASTAISTRRSRLTPTSMRLASKPRRKSRKQTGARASAEKDLAESRGLLDATVADAARLSGELDSRRAAETVSICRSSFRRSRPRPSRHAPTRRAALECRARGAARRTRAWRASDDLAGGSPGTGRHPPRGLRRGRDAGRGAARRPRGRARADRDGRVAKSRRSTRSCRPMRIRSRCVAN